MGRRTPLSSGRTATVVVFVGFLAAACGDDDGGEMTTAGSGGGGGDSGSSASSGSGGGGGSGGGAAGAGAGAGGTGTGTGGNEEGYPCGATAECTSGLACVEMRLAGRGVGVCARPCATNDECESESGEVCDSPFTGLPSDRHCVNLVEEPFAFCGIVETSLCAGERECLYFQGEPFGFCVNLCAADPGADAGVPFPATCPDAAQMCLGGIVQNEAVGVCGTEAGRDEVCGPDLGRFCSGDDICFPDDPNAEDSMQHCREDCSATDECTGGGTCTPINTQFSYCKK